MISYNPKEWFKFFTSFHKSGTFIILWPALIMVCCYSAAIAFIEIQYLQLSSNNYLKNITLMHSVLGFVISMLLVFRTNSAYDRWWEGRKQWGSLVNNSRNLAIKMSIILPKNETTHRNFFKVIIPQYAIALKNHLRKESTRLELDAKEHPEFGGLAYEKHMPIQVQRFILKRINDLYYKHKISNEQYINLNAEIQAYSDICGACERIKNTPIPYSYSNFLKKFIFFFVVTLPLGYVFSLGYWTVPVVAFIFYVLASLELISEEIEEPFGTDENDLPLQKICNNIEKQVGEIFDY